MPRLISEITELATGLGMLGYPDLDAARFDGDAVGVAPQRALIVEDVAQQLVVERLEARRRRAIDVPQHAGRRAQVRDRGPRELGIERIDELTEAFLARIGRPLLDGTLRDPLELGLHDDVRLGRADDAELVDDHGCPFKVASNPASAKNRFCR